MRSHRGRKVRLGRRLRARQVHRAPMCQGQPVRQVPKRPGPQGLRGRRHRGQREREPEHPGRSHQEQRHPGRSHQGQRRPGQRRREHSLPGCWRQELPRPEQRPTEPRHPARSRPVRQEPKEQRGLPERQAPEEPPEQPNRGRRRPERWHRGRLRPELQRPELQRPELQRPERPRRACRPPVPREQPAPRERQEPPGSQVPPVRTARRNRGPRPPGRPHRALAPGAGSPRRPWSAACCRATGRRAKTWRLLSGIGVHSGKGRRRRSRGHRSAGRLRWPGPGPADRASRLAARIIGRVRRAEPRLRIHSAATTPRPPATARPPATGPHHRASASPVDPDGQSDGNIPDFPWVTPECKL